jgi:hypothetical protein
MNSATFLTSAVVAVLALVNGGKKPKRAAATDTSSPPSTKPKPATRATSPAAAAKPAAAPLTLEDVAKQIDFHQASEEEQDALRHNESKAFLHPEEEADPLDLGTHPLPDKGIPISTMMSALPRGDIPFSKRKDAIKQFQSWSNRTRKTKLKVDGVMGPATKAALSDAYNASAPNTPKTTNVTTPKKKLPAAPKLPTATKKPPSKTKVATKKPAAKKIGEDVGFETDDFGPDFVGVAEGEPHGLDAFFNGPNYDFVGEDDDQDQPEEDDDNAQPSSSDFGEMDEQPESDEQDDTTSAADSGDPLNDAEYDASPAANWPQGDTLTPEDFGQPQYQPEDNGEGPPPETHHTSLAALPSAKKAAATKAAVRPAKPAKPANLKRKAPPPTAAKKKPAAKPKPKPKKKGGGFFSKLGRGLAAASTFGASEALRKKSKPKPKPKQIRTKSVLRPPLRLAAGHKRK